MTAHPADLLWLEEAELSVAERMSLNKHLDGCVACAQSRRDLVEAATLLGVQEAAVSIRPLTSRRHRALPQAFAATAVVIGVVIAAAVLRAAPVSTAVAPPAPTAASVTQGTQSVGTLVEAIGIGAAVSPGDPMPEIRWRTTTGDVRLRPTKPTIIVVWSGECASCGADAAAGSLGRTAAGVPEYDVLAIVSGQPPAELSGYAAAHPKITVIADPGRLLIAPAGGSRPSFLVLARDGRVSGLTSIREGMKLESLLAQARGMADPPIVGVIDSVAGDIVSVRLESPMMSSRYGTPARFRIGPATTVLPSARLNGQLKLGTGDRVRLAWTDEAFDVATRSYLALTIGAQ